MKLQVFSAAALSVLLLAVQPVSIEKANAAQSRPAKSSSQQFFVDTGVGEEHLSLAACFRELAAQERALADSHIRLAAIYENKTTPPGAGAVSAPKMADQYKRLAETERKAAAAAEGVAAYQSRVAEQVGNASVLTLADHGTRSFAALGK